MVHGVLSDVSQNGTWSDVYYFRSCCPTEHLKKERSVVASLADCVNFFVSESALHAVSVHDFYGRTKFVPFILQLIFVELI